MQGAQAPCIFLPLMINAECRFLVLTRFCQPKNQTISARPSDTSVACAGTWPGKAPAAEAAARSGCVSLLARRNR